MIELEDWQARSSAPPALALLKELLNGSGPTVYRIGGKFYLDEDEADRWLAGRRARPDERVRAKPPSPRSDPDTHNKLFGRAMRDFRAGLAEYDRYMTPKREPSAT
jgi:hypothetical protein